MGRLWGYIIIDVVHETSDDKWKLAVQLAFLNGQRRLALTCALQQPKLLALWTLVELQFPGVRCLPALIGAHSGVWTSHRSPKVECCR